MTCGGIPGPIRSKTAALCSIWPRSSCGRRRAGCRRYRLPAFAGGALELEQWLALLDLQGQVRTDSLSYDPAKGSNAQITLHDASLAVPANEQDRATPREQRYLAFKDVQGRVVFEGASVAISLTGRWRGGTCGLNGRIFADMATMQGFDDLGFDIELQGQNILLPARPGEQEPAEKRFLDQLEKLADFCKFYSPAGRVDVAFPWRSGRGASTLWSSGAVL